MSSFYLIPLILANIGAIELNSVYRSTSDVNVAVILRNSCNASAPLLEKALINSAIWTVQKINNFSDNLNFGLTIYKTCNEKEEYKTIFDLFQKEEFFIGLVTDSRLSPKVQKFSEILDFDTRQIIKTPVHAVKAAVALLSALNWVENVTVLAPDQTIIEEFSKISRNDWICVKEYVFYDFAITLKNSSSEIFVIFGEHLQLKSFIENSEMDNFRTIFVSLDGSVLNDLPDNSYVISPFAPDSFNNAFSPLFFDIAAPIVGYAQNLGYFLNENCNETIYKINCLRNKLKSVSTTLLEPPEIVDLLKIENFTPAFNYYIYKSENSSQPAKIFSYNIFNNNLTGLDSTIEADNKSEQVCKNQKSCRTHCKNFEVKGKIHFSFDGEVRIRTESWVFAFLSISLLGVLFCIAILIFLLVSICRRDVLDGNPVLTMLLLVAVMLMYCSILPMSLEGNKSVKDSICIARALAITFSFAAGFSLILSRSILLATASKEIGFMSHVAGPVQSFLCLFIFGVQAALSLQIIGKCCDLFKGHSFIYLLSYNAMLLLLQLCLCPLIVKCQRNYREGKYFTIAAAVIALLWCIWVPAYVFLGEEFQDAVLCFGLVSTGSVLIGTIFVPRTYLMTIAAARDKIRSTLPSLAAATSAMDIYRTGTQPVYDCVNVAAINAVTVARAGVTDLYSCPTLADDDDFVDVRCDSPGSDDKVTRF